MLTQRYFSWEPFTTIKSSFHLGEILQINFLQFTCYQGYIFVGDLMSQKSKSHFQLIQTLQIKPLQFFRCRHLLLLRISCLWKKLFSIIVLFIDLLTSMNIFFFTQNPEMSQCHYSRIYSVKYSPLCRFYHKMISKPNIEFSARWVPYVQVNKTKLPRPLVTEKQYYQYMLENINMNDLINR